MEIVKGNASSLFKFLYKLARNRAALYSVYETCTRKHNKRASFICKSTCLKRCQVIVHLDDQCVSATSLNSFKSNLTKTEKTTDGSVHGQ